MRESEKAMTERSLQTIREIVAGADDREQKARTIAEAIRAGADYRWVGLYDVDVTRGEVSNLAWSGHGPPAHARFEVSEGLTGAAIASRRTVNVGDVARDPRYLTAFATTRSEIIVPVLLDDRSPIVVGTIDVESDRAEAFDAGAQAFLEACARIVRPLWADDRRAKWEWSAAEIKRVGYRVVDLIADHVTTLPRKPVFRPFPRDLATRFLESMLPQDGEAADDILDAFEREIAPFPFGNGHPRFFGWVNSPPVVIGIFAEALAAAMNPSCAGGNHAAIYVERQVVNWFKQLIGFPRDSMGLLVSGGSMAALTSLAVARHVNAGFDVRLRGVQGTKNRLLIYRTEETHGCHQKAAELLGLGSDCLRTVPHDRALQMVPGALEAALTEDIDRGDRPIAVIATAGTVNTGAIDPLEEIADICARHHVWLHVDAAYGGPAILTERYAGRLSAVARADSVALDPHKWLYVPVEAGLVLVRSAESLRSAFSLVPPYLRTDGQLEGVGGPPWFSEFGYQQTRGFRALKVWMALRYHGISGYRASIDRDIDLGERLAAALRDAPDFELFEPTSLSIVCFRYVPAGPFRDVTALDALNKALLERVQLGGQVFLSSTVVDDRFWLRACFVNPRSREHDGLRIVDAVRDAAQSMMPSRAT
jgi:glutamate/tyrosine decarboxylase-like PLP-dependent enzyme/putative methionine-R-sulfoxide reductase with GAF domain